MSDPVPAFIPETADPETRAAWWKSQAEWWHRQAEMLQTQADGWKSKAEEYLELAKLAKADFINYQDRVRRDKSEWNRQALDSFLRELLPAMDGFSMANFEDPSLNEAFRMLEREFVKALGKAGATPIDIQNQSFDPGLHEAVAMDPGGTVIEEVRRGWLLDGKVLRPTAIRIVVPKAAPAPQ